jgi:hypothetical protein
MDLERVPFAKQRGRRAPSARETPWADRGNPKIRQEDDPAPSILLEAASRQRLTTSLAGQYQIPARDLGMRACPPTRQMCLTRVKIIAIGEFGLVYM